MTGLTLKAPWSFSLLGLPAVIQTRLVLVEILGIRVLPELLALILELILGLITVNPLILVVAGNT
jgi:hypothetical protein